MAWTAHRTWVTAEVVTAAQMNEQVRDNSTWLKANTAQLISETVLTGDAATITFTSIPATFKHLQIKWFARNDNDAINVEVQLTFNNDTGNNYHRLLTYIDHGNAYTATGEVGQAYLDGGRCAAGQAPADTFDMGEIHINGYASAVGEKAVIVANGNKTSDLVGGMLNMVNHGWWDAGVAAITEIDLDASAGNFIAGSVFSLYGLP